MNNKPTDQNGDGTVQRVSHICHWCFGEFAVPPGAPDEFCDNECADKYAKSLGVYTPEQEE